MLDPRDSLLPGWGPALPPQRDTLTGRFVRLEPVDVARDRDQLFIASHDARDPHLWDYLFVGPFDTKEEFARYLETCASSTTDVFFTVVDQATGAPSGLASYLRIVPKDGVIEIGHIWFSPAIQRRPQATEAIYILARHAFDDMRYRRLEWKCDALNARSRRAAERFGFMFEGIFRQHMVVKGKNRDTAWFAMLDCEWPTVRQAFEEWLDYGNFDEEGRQILTLANIRAQL